MAVPEEGTTALPRDAGNRYFQGNWDGAAFYAPRADNSTAKNLKVALYDTLGNPLLIADDAAFTPGTSRVVPIGAFADETSPDSVNEGDIGAIRMTLDRILLTAADRNSEVVVNAVALADNSGHDAEITTMPDGVKNLKIRVSNTLDQSVNVTVRDGGDAAQCNLFSVVAIAGGTDRYILPYGAVEQQVAAVKPVLISPPHGSVVGALRVFYQAPVAPSSGTLTIRLMWER